MDPTIMNSKLALMLRIKFKIWNQDLVSTRAEILDLNPNMYWCRSLREVVSNFQESGNRSKNSTFFLFAPKDPFGELFSKIIFKSSRELLFWQKIRTFEIGQNVPNLHNFYRAFSAFSQRSYKTTKNYLGFIFFQSCFSSLGIAFPLHFISNWTFFGL